MDIDRTYLDKIVETHTMVAEMKENIGKTQAVCDECLKDHEDRLRILAETKADEADLEKVGARVGRLEKVEWAVGGVVSFLGLARIWQFFQGGS